GHQQSPSPHRLTVPFPPWDMTVLLSYNTTPKTSILPNGYLYRRDFSETVLQERRGTLLAIAVDRWPVRAHCGMSDGMSDGVSRGISGGTGKNMRVPGPIPARYVNGSPLLEPCCQGPGCTPARAASSRTASASALWTC